MGSGSGLLCGALQANVMPGEGGVLLGHFLLHSQPSELMSQSTLFPGEHLWSITQPLVSMRDPEARLQKGLYTQC